MNHSDMCMNSKTQDIYANIDHTALNVFKMPAVEASIYQQVKKT